MANGFSDINEIKEALLTALDSELTATAWAQKIGYTKIRPRVRAAIEELIEAGQVVAGENARGNTVYTVVEAPAEEAQEQNWSPEDDEEGFMGDDEAAGPGQGQATAAQSTAQSSFILPGVSYGYTIRRNDAGSRFFWHVTMPDGKEIELTATERLLVINQDPNYRFVVTTPEDVLSSIATFTEEKGYATFLVTEMATGRHIRSPEDLGNEVVLFLQIARHNKAG